MQDLECVQFLQWALPRLRMRWAGFRKVRRQVCKRISRRMRELDLPDLAAYRTYLDHQPGEWERLDGLCRVTISRFYRDHQVWHDLGVNVLPELARDALLAGRAHLDCWSVGCASGEEPFTLALVWERELAPRFPGLTLRILATDSDKQMLDRAARAVYPTTALKELPLTWRGEMFHRHGRSWRLAERYRDRVTFRTHDIRQDAPAGFYSLILCRNLIFTYFDTALQKELLARLATVLQPEGVLVLGGHEMLPPDTQEFRCRRGQPCFWQKGGQN